MSKRHLTVRYRHILCSFLDTANRLGVSQAQVSRIEKEGYNAYTLTTLRRYVEALGEGYTLDVMIRIPTINGSERAPVDGS